MNAFGNGVLTLPQKIFNVDVKFISKYLIYLGRWQLSTPILAIVLMFLGAGIEGVVIANLIGGLIFFWIDRILIQKQKTKVLSIDTGKKYGMYLFRWQLTSITMLPIVMVLGGDFFGVFMANLIGGLLFFWVDQFIFNGNKIDILSVLKIRKQVSIN